MYYLLIKFEYTITDFHGDNEKNEYNTLLYFGVQFALLLV